MKPQTFPKVKEALKALKEQGHTLTIASSRRNKSLSELTHDLDIADYFSYLVGADDVAQAKTCGVTYGNGTRAELQEAEADYITSSFEELIEVLRTDEYFS